VRNPTFQQEHEATTSNVSDDQLFYCQQRGLKTEDAISLIVGGFCNDVFSKLPMEFAIEANQLLAVSLEGSVG
jgi:Fe-S cluster assembly protein SufB